jgi:hypothetical protein
MLAATEFFNGNVSTPGVRDRAYHDQCEYRRERDQAEWYRRRGHDRPRDKGHNPCNREHVTASAAAFNSKAAVLRQSQTTPDAIANPSLLNLQVRMRATVTQSPLRM